MSIIFVTYATNKRWYDECAVPLRNSARHFHPNIPFEIIDPTSYLTGIYNIRNSKPLIGREFAKNYDRVVLLDADCLITGSLDELIEGDYDLAGVRNSSDHGSVQFANPNEFAIPGLATVAQFLNGGLTAGTGPEVWEDWDALNIEYSNSSSIRGVGTRGDADEQTTWNILAYEGKYRLTVLDSPEKGCYYGVANTWGYSAHPWESWKALYLDGGGLVLQNLEGVNKWVKILHRAGKGFLGDPQVDFYPDLFTEEVWKHLSSLMEAPV